MTFKNDKEAMSAFGLSDAEIGRVLNRTRQAINAGLKNEIYFAPHELRALYGYMSERPNFDLEGFRAFIRASRPQEADSIITGAILSGTGLERIQNEGQVIWAILPDYRYFIHQYPVAADAVLSLFNQDPRLFGLILTDKRDYEAFQAYVDASELPSRVEAPFYDDMVNAVPYLIIEHPLSPKKCRGFALTEGVFQEIPKVRAYDIARYFDTLIKTKGAAAAAVKR